MEKRPPRPFDRGGLRRSRERGLPAIAAAAAVATAAATTAATPTAAAAATSATTASARCAAAAATTAEAAAASSSAEATASTSTSTSTSTAAAAGGALARLVHGERAAIDVLAVKLVDRLLRILVSLHLDEAEATRLACHPVGHQLDADRFDPRLLERTSNAVLRRMEGQIPHIQSLGHLRLTVHDPPATPREPPWIVIGLPRGHHRGGPLGAPKPRRARRQSSLTRGPRARAWSVRGDERSLEPRVEATDEVSAAQGSSQAPRSCHRALQRRPVEAPPRSARPGWTLEARWWSSVTKPRPSTRR